MSISELRSARTEASGRADRKRTRSRTVSPSPKGASTVPVTSSGSPLTRTSRNSVRPCVAHHELDLAELVLQLEEGVLARAALGHALLELAHHAAQGHLGARPPLHAVGGVGVGEAPQLAGEPVQRVAADVKAQALLLVGQQLARQPFVARRCRRRRPPAGAPGCWRCRRPAATAARSGRSPARAAPRPPAPWPRAMAPNMRGPGDAVAARRCRRRRPT